MIRLQAVVLVDLPVEGQAPDHGVDHRGGQRPRALIRSADHRLYQLPSGTGINGTHNQLTIIQGETMIKTPDFIIPFLISHSAEAISKMQTTIKKKRYSVPAKAKEPNANSSMELTRIYKVTRKKVSPEKPERAKSPKRQEKTGKLETQAQSEGLREKGQSQLELNLHRSPYIARNRFFKAHSLINHLPAHNFSEDIVDFRHSPPKQSPPRLIAESPIPGVRFKKKSLFNQSANLLLPATPEDEQRSEFAGKIKHWREKKEWSRKRSANVDFIVNRRCKNFSDLIAEFRKRLALPDHARIFVFNSKDQWMRRALCERGWIENANKDSRAFHLQWSSKVVKEVAFPEQLLNHYPGSDLLTSKAGLHRMLLKHRLAHLQPTTFDLALQRPDFILYFTKLAFISGLTKLIRKFEFQEDADLISFPELRAQLTALKRQAGPKGVIQADLMGLAESCFTLLEGRVHELTTCYLENVLFKIHSMLQLNQTEEQLVRIIRDFEVLSVEQGLFEAEGALGTENVWLSKSKNSSKGVGIALHKDVDEILKHSNRLAQKYVENPLIFADPALKGRKFDVRVWVLLVGSLKARLYYHQKFYGRLCFEPYSLDTINLDNQRKHLTNYAQNKLSFKDDALDSILLPDTIFALVRQERGVEFRSRFFEEVEGMLGKMAVIFRNEIAAGSSNSFELFGLDLLIDSHLRLHLLEVNLSAACEERHEALSSMMEDVAHGMLNILDGRTQQEDLRGWKIVN